MVQHGNYVKSLQMIMALVAMFASLLCIPRTVYAAIPVLDYPAMESTKADDKLPDDVYEQAQKGLRFYTNFPNVPDFYSYKHFETVYAVEYECYEDNFYYLESPDVSYVYRSQIYNYLGVDLGQTDDYKKYLQLLGFKPLNSVRGTVLGEYGELIYEELLYDPDFKLNSIFIEDTRNDFTLLLIGSSLANGSDGKLAACMEIRLYSLTHSLGVPESITNFVPGTADRVSGAASYSADPNAEPGVQTYYNIPDYDRYTNDGSQSQGTKVHYGTPDYDRYINDGSQSQGTKVHYDTPDYNRYTNDGSQSQGTKIHYEAVSPGNYTQSGQSNTQQIDEVSDYIKKMETNLTK